MYPGVPIWFSDDPIKKPQKELQAVGVGTKARPRFHGAFTGGFSAGYFNTVGSKDGTCTCIHKNISHK